MCSVNVAMLAHLNYVKQRFDILRVLSVSDGRIVRHKHLKRAAKQPLPRRFWVRPGRTSLWWDNFISRKGVEEEWRENLRMSQLSLYRLADKLRPQIEGKTTIMRAPVDAVKEVAITHSILRLTRLPIYILVNL